MEAGLPAALRSPKSSEDLVCISSSFIPDPSKRANPSELSSVFVHRFPCLPGYFSGVGDLFSALVLAHYRPSLPTLPQFAPPTQTPLSIATSHALSKTFSILEFTSAQLLSLPEEERTLTDDEADGATDAISKKTQKDDKQAVNIVEARAANVCSRCKKTDRPKARC